MVAVKCLRCGKPATRRVRAKYDRMWWHGCDEHWQQMHAALYLGQPADGSAVHIEKVVEQ